MFRSLLSFCLATHTHRCCFQTLRTRFATATNWVPVNGSIALGLDCRSAEQDGQEKPRPEQLQQLAVAANHAGQGATVMSWPEDQQLPGEMETSKRKLRQLRQKPIYIIVIYMELSPYLEKT